MEMKRDLNWPCSPVVSAVVVVFLFYYLVYIGFWEGLKHNFSRHLLTAYSSWESSMVEWWLFAAAALLPKFQKYQRGMWDICVFLYNDEPRGCFWGNTGDWRMRLFDGRSGPKVGSQVMNDLVVQLLSCQTLCHPMDCSTPVIDLIHKQMKCLDFILLVRGSHCYVLK